MNIQSISFGKTPVMRCVVKSADKKEKNSATLYEMDINNPSDCKEITYSKNARCLQQGLYTDLMSGYPAYKYYLLKDDKTQEVIACAQTSRHYREAGTRKTTYTGKYTLIDEMEANKKYINGAEPVLAYIAYNADSQFDNFVSAAFDKDEVTPLRQEKFTQLRTGDWAIPKKRFSVLIDRAKEKEDINFLV